MHPGAHLVTSRFPCFDEARKVLASIPPDEWKQTWPDGPFKTDGWFVIPLACAGKRTPFVDRHPGIGKALDYFEDPIGSAVLYSMHPGAEVHPHRDLSGTLALGGVKYHVPLETNPGVTFQIGRKNFSMKAGELWALNTSYIHGVQNHGESERIHLVVQVDTGKWSLARLPRRNLRFYAHTLCFFCMILWRGVTKLLSDRNALKLYANMVRDLRRRLFRNQAV